MRGTREWDSLWTNDEPKQPGERSHVNKQSPILVVEKQECVGCY